jgi:uncharacterized phage infection (PIP) family protein YhgE
MTSKAQSSTVKFDHLQPEGLVCFTITSREQNNKIAQRAFAFKNEAKKEEPSIEKLKHTHNIRKLQQKNNQLKELLAESDKGQELLLQEVISAQTDLFGSQTMEAQKETENQRLREENESLKKSLENNCARLRTSIRRSYENSLRQLESDNDFIEDEIMKVEEENMKLQEENQALAKKLSEANEELSRLKAKSKESKS